jgi:DNA mismatch endonuclease (patch repair protein)
MTDVFSKQKRSQIMAKIKGKWTTPEKVIHAHLKSQNIRHKMHPKMVGNPDVLIKDSNIVVFVDGNFWHGRHYNKRRDSLPPFWKAKIETNMKRDRKNNLLLKAEGWNVIRFWEEDIRKNPGLCIERVKAYIDVIT